MAFFILDLNARRRRAASAIAIAAILAGCGGGGGDPTTTTAGDSGTTADEDWLAADTSLIEAQTTLASIQATTTTVPNCERVPAAATPALVRKAGDFGAKPGDSVDDTAALQKGLDALKAGEALQLSGGKYLISKSLHIKNANVTLQGDGTATLHATNPDDMSVLIENSGVTVAKLSFTAVTSGRRSAPRHTRIAVAAGLPNNAGYAVVKNTVIRDNRIEPTAAPGTAEANSASSAGILMLNADGFLITGNTVSRTLADGIHMTGGSRNGRVLNNTVRQTGDDMIAVVSYAASGNAVLNTASAMQAGWDESRLDRNILVAGNVLSAPYWGRGISVIGGQQVTIARNSLDNMPLAAGIILAREANYQTFGVNDVLVDSNVVRNVQNMAPPYDYNGTYSKATKTGHGAIEMHASYFADEATNTTLAPKLTVQNVLMRNNKVEITTVAGARMGVTTNKTLTAVDANGKTVSRQMVSGTVQKLSSQNGTFNQVKGEPLYVLASNLVSSGVNCSGNLRDGATYQPAVCKAAAPTVAGAVMSCSSEGKLQ